LREGVERLPVAQLAGVELDIRLLVDHREQLVRMRTALYNDLLWHLHDLWPEQSFPSRARGAGQEHHPTRQGPRQRPQGATIAAPARPTGSPPRRPARTPSSAPDGSLSESTDGLVL
jgi:hypothetical protein